MSGLSLAHRKAIGRALRTRDPEIGLGPVWKEIYRYFGIGRIEGRKLRLTAADFETLRKAADIEFGGDPRESLSTLDRIEAAPYTLDEKQAGRRPNEGYVLIKGAGFAPLLALPDGCALRVSLDLLDIEAISCVLVVENLDCFDQIHRFTLPDKLHDALVVYRGHSASTGGNWQLLRRLPASATVTVFPDHDPAGLAIAASLPRSTHLLTPALTAPLLAKGNREHFQRQHKQARHLDSIALGGWQTVWAEMKLAGVSIKQQHMLAQGSALSCVER